MGLKFCRVILQIECGRCDHTQDIPGEDDKDAVSIAQQYPHLWHRVYDAWGERWYCDTCHNKPKED